MKRNFYFSCLLFFLGFIMSPLLLNAQNITVEADGNDCYYSEPGCSDCNGGVDPQWRNRLVINAVNYDWNDSRDDRACGWMGVSNASWVNAIVVPWTSNVEFRMNSYEGDGGLCGADDGQCVGYVLCSTRNIATRLAPCGWVSLLDTVHCFSDATDGTWQVRWQMRWSWVAATLNSTHAGTVGLSVATDANICLGRDPAIINGLTAPLDPVPSTTGTIENIQWELNSGAGYGIIAGANGLTYDPPAPTTTGTYQYRRRIQFCTDYSTGTLTTFYSNVITINVGTRNTGNRNVQICAPSSFLAGGSLRTSSGTFYDTLYNRNVFGCDSVLTTVLTVNPRPTASRTVSICSPNTFVAGGAPRGVSGTYYDTLISASYLGCDSVLTTILNVGPLSVFVRSISICEPATYLAGGSPRSVSGVYYDTLRGAALSGCDSLIETRLTVGARTSRLITVTICSPATYFAAGAMRSSSGVFHDTLRNANYLGCDSVLTTSLVVNPRSSQTQSITVCQPSGFTAGGAFQTTSGTYIDTLRNANIYGCDSILTTILTVNPRTFGTRNPTICFPSTFVAGGAAQSSSGTYYDTLRNANVFGCDSVLTTVLTVRPRTSFTRNVTLCFPETFFAGGAVQSASGVYVDTLRNANYVGCDSILETRLTINPRGFGLRNVTICETESFFAGGAIQTTAGAYFDTLRNASYLGCDSILQTFLFVNPWSFDTVTYVLCNGNAVTINGITYSATGIYFDTLTNYLNCDSVLTIDFTLVSSVSDTQDISICDGDSYSVGTSTYSFAGTYLDTLVSFGGCDSILLTNLSLRSTSAIVQSPVICPGQSVRVGTNVYSTTGVYYDTLTNGLGCDSIVITQLTRLSTSFASFDTSVCTGQSISIGTRVYNSTGAYTDTLIGANGCDSILITNLTVQSPASQTIDTILCQGDSYSGVVINNDTVLARTLTSSIGCDSILYTVRVAVRRDTALVASADASVCPGASISLSVSGGSGNYLWLPPATLSCSNCPNPVANPVANTLYTVSSTDCRGNIISESVLVQVLTSPTINILTSDTSILQGQSVSLIAQGDSLGSIRWTIGSGAVCSNCPTVTIQPPVSATYFATITDSNGCESTDSVLVLVRTDCFIDSIEIPNVISPNGDGSNEGWYMKNPANVVVNLVQVFNRWGQLIFESDSDRFIWDGTYLGKPCNPGVYVYLVKGFCTDRGGWIREGNITLIR